MRVGAVFVLHIYVIVGRVLLTRSHVTAVSGFGCLGGWGLWWWLWIVIVQRNTVCLHSACVDTELCAACVFAAADLQAQFTGQSMETITRDTDRDFFMSPQEAIEYGLVDAIIAKPQVLPTRELATA